MAVENVEEPADDVLVRAGQRYFDKKFISSKSILGLREPGHCHGRVVSDQLKQRGAEPHEHVVHLRERKVIVPNIKLGQQAQGSSPPREKSENLIYLQYQQYFATLNTLAQNTIVL